MRIETERLILRYFTLEDTPDVYKYSCNPRVAVPAAWLPHKTMEYSRRIVEKFIRSKEIAIWSKELGRVIGSIGVFSPVDSALNGREISYALAEEVWGQGLMKEALNYAIGYIFEEYRCPSLYLCNFLDNSASRRVAEGIGFTYIKEFLYTDIPDGSPKMVRYYELKYEDFYEFRFSFTKEEYRDFRNLVGFKALEENQLNAVIENSTYRIAVRNQGRIVGMARCISDKAYLYLLCDVMVHPQVQHRGIGKRMLNRFIKNLKYKIGNQYAKIYIMSLKGKEGFYQSVGFTEDIATGLTIEWEGKTYENEGKKD